MTDKINDMKVTIIVDKEKLRQELSHGKQIQETIQQMLME